MKQTAIVWFDDDAHADKDDAPLGNKNHRKSMQTDNNKKKFYDMILKTTIMTMIIMQHNWSP